MLYILYCVDDMGKSKEIREKLKDRHLEYLARHQQLILLGGAMLADDQQTRLGSVLVLNAADRETVENFSLNEPYRRAGLYSSVSIRRMRRAQWNPAIAPTSPDGN